MLLNGENSLLKPGFKISPCCATCNYVILEEGQDYAFWICNFGYDDENCNYKDEVCPYMICDLYEQQ
jgi:hypothetical protein